MESLGKGERTRARLLGLAVARFARSGFRRTSLADVARDAGLTPTAVYAYFPSKEALFHDAVDADAAGLIAESFGPLDLGQVLRAGWGDIVEHLVAGLEGHPLARRVLSGLEPDVIARVIDLPAVADLRSFVAAELSDAQDEGVVRSDVDPKAMALGLETIVLALLITHLQVGSEGVENRQSGIRAVLQAALRPSS